MPVIGRAGNALCCAADMKGHGHAVQIVSAFISIRIAAGIT
jgi:hypothetical protein